MVNLPIYNKEAFLITDNLTREYLSGIKLAEGYLLLSKSPTYFADARYFSAVRPVIEEKGMSAKLYTGLECIKKELKQQRIKKLYLDFDKTTLSEYAEYLEFGIKLYDGSRALKLERAVKKEFELECIKKACEITEKALKNIVSEFKQGITEESVKIKLEKEMLKLGADDIAFDSIVAFGKNSAVPHHQTGKTKLEENSVILIDTGCKINGYCSDITRTYFFGQPDEKFKACYSAVLTANLKAIEDINERMSTDKADKVARSILKEKGLDKYFTHSLGHGVGLEIHEFPTLSPRQSEKLEEGMVFTIEPGVYFDGEFGIRIEDTVVLKNGKIQRLFTDEKELLIIK